MDAARGIKAESEGKMKMKKIAGRPPGTKMQDECISVFCDSSKLYACKDAAGVGGGLTKIFAHTGRTGKEQYALQEFAQIQANDAVVADDVCTWSTLWPYTISDWSATYAAGTRELTLVPDAGPESYARLDSLTDDAFWCVIPVDMLP